MKKNCWEFKGCGREPGGKNAEILGICPATIESHLDGTHGGKNAGRACWVVAGTLCRGEVQGTFAKKFGDCLKCDFFQLVRKEEGNLFIISTAILKMLREKKSS